MNEKKEPSFFKKVIISIKDIERYPELASKNLKLVFLYLLKIMIIFTIITTTIFSYTLIKELNNVQTDIKDENASDEDIQISSANITNSSEQNVKLLNKLINEISKYSPGSSKIFIYAEIICITYIYMLLVNFITVILDILLLGAFGYFTAIVLRLHLRYLAMCKIATYSLTLPIVLNGIYLVIKTFFGFEIKYFQIMYIGVAYVYIIASILMIKTDVIKNREELNRIMQEQEKVREELKRKEKEEEKNQESKDNKDGKEKKEEEPENRETEDKEEEQGECN